MTPESEHLMLEYKVKIAEEENKRFDWKFKEETKLSNPELLKSERDNLIFFCKMLKLTFSTNIFPVLFWEEVLASLNIENSHKDFTSFKRDGKSDLKTYLQLT